MRRRLLVTGGAGVVASYVRQAFRDWDVVLAPRTELDVTDHDAVNLRVSTMRPHVVLHLAAKTDVDWCEQHPLEAFRVNAEGTGNVAGACLRSHATMVYISTAGVFDRADPSRTLPFLEHSKPRPANVYGQTKLAGEWAASRILQHDEGPRLLIVRSGWMFGGGSRDTKFVGKILRQIHDGVDPIVAVDDKVGSPTYALDLLRLIRTLLEQTELRGVVHGANTGPIVSRYDVACEILDFHEAAIVEPCSSDRFPLPAPRAASEALASGRVPEKLAPRDWREALAEYVSEQAA